MNPNFRECPLPDDLEAERFVLGTALSDPEAWPQITGLLGSEDFSLEKHKRIFLRMGELFERGEPINCADLAYELRKLNQLDSVDGLSYLVEIADVPRLLNLERFCERVRETSVRRQVILSAWLLIDRCGSNSYERGESLGELERIREILNTSRRRVAGRVWDEIVADEGGIN
jgi:replicative DNA helicase